MDRDRRGRFTCGNTIARQGWRGLVQKCFDGDTAAARAWIAQLGRHTYARQCIEGTRFEYRLQTIWKHPGKPEQFTAAWRESLNFSLADVEVVEP